MTTTERLAQALERIANISKLALNAPLHAEIDEAQGIARAALATWEAEKATQPLILETAEEARKDREHAEAYYRQAEKLLTSNEATLHARIRELEAEKASEQRAERKSDFELADHFIAWDASEGHSYGELMRAIESACAAKWGVKLSSQEGASDASASN